MSLTAPLLEAGSASELSPAAGISGVYAILGYLQCVSDNSNNFCMVIYALYKPNDSSLNNSLVQCVCTQSTHTLPLFTSHTYTLGVGVVGKM